MIIVTFNNEKNISACLSSVIKNSSANIIVVDNASSDKTVEKIKGFKDKVVLVQSKVNSGFAKGVNLGVENSKSEYLVLLNPDTKILKNGDLEKMRDALIENPEFGLIGPKFVYPDGKSQATVRKLPTPWRAFQEYILGIDGAYDFYQPACSGICNVESVVGACMVMARKTINMVGGLNETYFMYFEDLDFCRATQNLGLKIGYLPSVTIEHTVGASGGGFKTNIYASTSAPKYYGWLNYYLTELILTPRRIENKIKKILCL